MAARGSNASAFDPAEPGSAKAEPGESRAGRTARFRHQASALAEHRLRLGRIEAKIHEHIAAARDAARVVPARIVLLHEQQVSEQDALNCLRPFFRLEFLSHVTPYSNAESHEKLSLFRAPQFPHPSSVRGTGEHGLARSVYSEASTSFHRTSNYQVQSCIQ